MSIEVDIVEYGSKAYAETLRLRDEVLRAPLGLKLEAKDVAHDREDVHMVARGGTKIVGCLIIRTLSEDFKMRQVAVAESHRGKGVGRRLVAAAEAFARGRNARDFVLNARRSAVEFYTSLGYVSRGEPFVEVGLPHVEMYKRLRGETAKD